MALHQSVDPQPEPLQILGVVCDNERTEDRVWLGVGRTEEVVDDGRV